MHIFCPNLDNSNTRHKYLVIFFFLIRQVLILVPTRELALQTSSIVKEIGKHTGVQCMVRKDVVQGYSNRGFVL